MKFDLIIVRYGEIALKSSYVRNKFERILIENIKSALKKERIENKVERERGRIYIYTPKIDHALDILGRIFGVVSFSPSVKTSSDLKSISDKSLIFSKKYLDKNMSFALRTSRTGNHNYTSQDVAVEVGKDIVENIGCSVDLTNPDFELFIDIREDKAYIFKDKIPGPGGMPLGSQDRVLCIIDSASSILASWHILRRGCSALFLCKEGFDKNALYEFLKRWHITKKIVFYRENDDFYKIVNIFVSEHKCKAVVTGFFNLKKDISKIKEFKKEISVSILYPLITMDENDINNNLKEIGVNL